MANQTSLAHPYVNAIFELAQSGNTVDDWLSNLRLLSQVAQSKEFNNLIGNPNLSGEEVVDITYGFTSQTQQELRNLLFLLCDNDRLQVLPDIYVLFEQKVEQERNMAKALVQSAFSINDSDKKKLEQKLTAKFGKTITATVEVCPELIGGIRVLINDTVIDASVKGSLAKLAAQLIS
ncbi:MAG: F-type H+-transporting ATPase subunit delta [Pseudomonadota bacterium]|nr:F-type H+-transporting ATPase subunit delta [Pseudomonadota bacterium]